MIGLIAGEIIASPYSYNNIKSTADIFFPLFESTRKGYFVNKKSSARVDNIDNIDRREQKGYSYRETRFDPSAGLYCESACAVARDLLGHSHPYDESTTVDPLIAAAVCGMFIPNKGDAISYANHIAISSSGNGRLGFPDVHAMASLTWMAYHGHTKEEIIKEAKAFNLEIYVYALLRKSIGKKCIDQCNQPKCRDKPHRACETDRISNSESINHRQKQ